MTAWLFVKALPYLIGLIALAGLYWRGHHNGIVKATREVMESYRKTAKAIDHADTGIGASDAERVNRLRDFAGKP